MPGTTRTVAAAALERTSGRSLGRDLAVAFNPEFLREATAIYDFDHPPKIVVGASDERSGGCRALALRRNRCTYGEDLDRDG